MTTVENIYKCGICNKVTERNSARYPNAVCEKCIEIHGIKDKDDNVVDFFNIEGGSEFIAVHYYCNSETYTNEDHECWINSVKCRTDEARFGGIVIIPETVTNYEKLLNAIRYKIHIDLIKQFGKLDDTNCFMDQSLGKTFDRLFQKLAALYNMTSYQLLCVISDDIIIQNKQKFIVRDDTETNTEISNAIKFLAALSKVNTLEKANKYTINV